MRSLRFAVALVTLSLASLGVHAAELLVPGVASLSGANGTRFESDLVLTNPTAEPVDVAIALVPSGGQPAPAAHSLTLAAFQSVTFDPALSQLWGWSEGGGALRVSSSRPIVVRARTYNAASSGRFGLALPVLRTRDVLEVGELATIPWISQSSDSTSGFRTNIGLLFPDPNGGAATVVLLGARGEELGRKTYDVAQAAFLQEPVRAIGAAGEVARAALIVTRGRAQAYSSVVDNVTGDSSVFSAERSSAANYDAFITGVAHTAGANGSFFVTDLRLVNANGVKMTATLEFLSAGRSVTRTVSLLPMETLELRDVLAQTFGASDSSSGSLRISAPGTLYAAARTSNVSLTGASGTFGAQQQAVSVSALSNAASVLSGVTQDVDARTNAGFMAGGAGATLRLNLKSSAGVSLGSTTLVLGPFEWRQSNVAALFGLPLIERGATLFAESDGGAYTAYLSVVDQRSGDASVSAAVSAACSDVAPLDSDAAVCRNGEVVLKTQRIGGASYTWTISGGRIVFGAGTESVVVRPDTTASRIDASVAIDVDGCVTTRSRSVSVTEAPSFTSSAVTATNSSSPVTIRWEATGGISGFELRGTDFATPLSLPATARSYVYTPTAAGAKSVSITALGICGSPTATANYSVTTTSSRASGGKGGAYPGTFAFNGAQGRSYVVYVPANYSPSTPAPLVYAWGGQGEPASMTLAVAWRDIADRDGVLVVTMTADSSGPGYSGAYDTAEFLTMQQAESEVPAKYNVDLQRVYFWGFSAGAHVTYMFALEPEHSNRLAAFAIQAGAIEAAATRVNPPSWPPQSGARRLPVYISCGQLDTTGSGGGLIGALRRNADMLTAERYTVSTREVPNQTHTYTVADVEMAWSYLSRQRLP